MPIQSCRVNGKAGKRWGKSGKCYTGSNARARALRQAAAIRASGWTENQRRADPLRVDPTRTLMLRRKFEADLARRFAKLRRKIVRLIVEEDAFGLRLPKQLFTNEERDNGQRAISEVGGAVGNGNRGIDGGNEAVRGDSSGGYNSDQPVQGVGGEGTGGGENRAEGATNLVVQPTVNKERNDVSTSDVATDKSRPSGVREQAGYVDQRIGNSQAGVTPVPRADGPVGSGEVTRGGGSKVGTAGSDVVAGTERLADSRAAEVAAARRNLVVHQRWAFHSNPQKVLAFQSWLQTQVQAEILTTTAENVEQAYWTAYTEEGYRKGAARAFDDTRKAALWESREGDFFQGTKEEFLRSSFARPVAVEKVRLLAGRVFTDLKGVTQDMSTKMTRQLTDGLVQGMGPREVARNMIKEGMGFTKTRGIQSRALTIARTETIRAHAEGQLDALEQLGVTKIGVMVEWTVAANACPLCFELDGVILTIREARGIIPRHPNCRCAFMPANVGEPKRGQVRGKTNVKKAMDDSIRKELPKIKKRSLAEQKRRTSWPGADKTIAKTRPISVVSPRAAKPKVRKAKPKPPPVVKPKQADARSTLLRSKRGGAQAVVEARLRAATAETSTEFGAVFDRKGKLISDISVGRAKGIKGLAHQGVQTPVTADMGSGLTRVHTHPGKAPPSRADVLAFYSDTDVVTKSRILHADGGYWEMTKTSAHKGTKARLSGHEVREKLLRIEEDLIIDAGMDPFANRLAFEQAVYAKFEEETGVRVLYYAATE